MRHVSVTLQFDSIIADRLYSIGERTKSAEISEAVETLRKPSTTVCMQHRHSKSQMKTDIVTAQFSFFFSLGSHKQLTSEMNITVFCRAKQANAIMK